MLLKEPQANYEPIQGEQNKANAPFSADDLLTCWNAYSETLENKVYLMNTMINCKPILLENNQFEIVVHNPVQREELINNSIDILNALRTELKNSFIQMQVRIDEVNEKKLAYTSTEKYEFLENINPMLSKLKDIFDLTLD